MSHAHKRRCDHLFRDLSNAIAREGKCRFHASGRGSKCHLTKRPDGILCGFPCQPWVGFHGKAKGSSHPFHKVTIQGFQQYIIAASPLGGVLENTTEIDRPVVSIDTDTQTVSTDSDLDHLIRFLNERGYSVDRIHVDMSAYLDVARKRLLSFKARLTSTPQSFYVLERFRSCPLTCSHSIFDHFKKM